MAATKRSTAVKKAAKRRLSKKPIKLGNISITQKQLLVGGVVAALLAVGLYFGRTEKVVVTVAINAEYGGVFADPNGCEALPEYKDSIEDISVTAASGEAIPMTEISWVSTEKNLCEGTFTLSLSPFSTYDVSIDSAKVGSIAEASFSSKSAEFSKTISVTRDLSGEHDLVETATYCTGPLSDWSCTWSYWDYGKNFDGDTTDGSCAGNGGYDDLRDGATVVVYNSTGAIVGTTTLYGSSYDLESLSSRKITCTFKWELKNVPNDDAGYSVEVTSRGKVFYSGDELLDNGFSLDTTIGD
jgi:hypothetical protein